MQQQFDLEGPPFYLFIGDADRESVVSKLKIEGVEYKRKMLESGQDNWAQIIDMLARPDLAGVLLKLPAHSWKRLLDPRYLPLTKQLFSALQSKPHMAFIHEDILSTKPKEGQSDDWYYDYSNFEKLNPSEIAKAKGLLADYEIEVAFYRTNAEMSVMAMEFLDRNAHGLVFRIYVPNEQIFAREIGKVIDLFRDYLSRVSNINLKEERYSTDSGYILEFFVDGEGSAIDLPAEFEKFGQFMDNCVTDADAAQQLLQLKSISPATAMQIVDRYARETKRIVVDVRHERERKLLSVRQRLEAELVDEIRDNDEWRQVVEYAGMIIPELPLIGTAGTLALEGGITNNIAVHARNFTVDQRVMDHVTQIAIEEMNGNFILSTEAKNLLELIEKHAGESKQELVNAVYELEDSGQKNSGRFLSANKLRSFLERSRDHIEGALWGTLEAYIKAKLGI